MKRIVAVVFFIFLHIPTLKAEVKCSSSGTQLIYINGVNVKSEDDTIKSAKKIDKVINNKFSIDYKGIVPPADHVYNSSRGALADIQKLKQELATNAPNGVSKEQYWMSLVATELNLDEALNANALDMGLRPQSPQDNNEILMRSKKALDYILSKKNLKNSLDNSSFMNSAFYKEIAVYNKKVADIIANAATEVDTLVKLKTKMDNYYRKNIKVIVVSHSQGNEALRSSLQLYRSELTGEDKINFEKYFGALQVAPPSPILATSCSSFEDTSPSCHSRLIKLDNDMVIGKSKYIIKNNDPITPNYTYNNSASNASGYSDLSSIIEYGYNLLGGAVFHAMDEIYLNDKIYANSVKNNDLLSMTDIFNRRLNEVAQTLESNCSDPKIELTASEATVDKDGIYQVSGYAGKNRKIHLDVKDVAISSDSAKALAFGYNHDETLFFWSVVQKYPSVENKPELGEIKVFEEQMRDSIDLAVPYRDVEYEVTVKAINQFNKEMTRTFNFKVESNIAAVISLENSYCIEAGGNTTGIEEFVLNIADDQYQYDGIQKKYRTNVNSPLNIFFYDGVEYTPFSHSFNSACAIEPSALELVPGSSTYKLMYLVNSDYPLDQPAVLHSVTGSLAAKGPYGTIFGTVSPIGYDDIINVDCGAWTKINSTQCQRSSGQPYSTFFYVHHVAQCGGEGCFPIDGFLAGDAILDAYSNIQTTYYTGTRPMVDF